MLYLYHRQQDDPAGMPGKDKRNNKGNIMYYGKSGTFANCIQIEVFSTRNGRDAWVENEQIDAGCYDAMRMAITRREADSILARNRRQERNHRSDSGYVQNFGTTEMPEPHPEY